MRDFEKLAVADAHRYKQTWTAFNGTAHTFRQPGHYKHYTRSSVGAVLQLFPVGMSMSYKGEKYSPPFYGHISQESETAVTVAELRHRECGIPLPVRS